MSIRNSSSYFYQRDSTILQQVDSSPYLGVTISSDLSWSTHITKITKRANFTVGFLRRNLKHCPMECRRLAFILLVRSTFYRVCGQTCSIQIFTSWPEWSEWYFSQLVCCICLSVCPTLVNPSKQEIILTNYAWCITLATNLKGLTLTLKMKYY